MLIKDLPEPIKNLAELRCREHCCRNNHDDKKLKDKLKGHISNAFVFAETDEKYDFWLSINAGNFTPYILKYGNPKKELHSDQQDKKNISKQEIEYNLEEFMASIPKIDYFESDFETVFLHNLRNVIKEKGVSNLEIAETLQVKKSKVKKLLSGARKISYVETARLCFLLKVDPKDILPKLKITEFTYEVLPLK